jgi:hypothetical protein
MECFRRPELPLLWLLLCEAAAETERESGRVEEYGVGKNISKP